ncbi:hypothetical protein BDA96_08G154300 [Sorghum bicolor]|uniref:Uncharacterized protein n=1 Tax=Sorghum bicolor TaxID=4558 RepID=A0A921U871_SORBI|nr:hypothetical protein BDA96_08G154300 [Sorghum bicolor]
MPKKECLEAPQCRRVKRNCPCGVLAKYGLVPSELGVGLFCGHTVDRDISTPKCDWEQYWEQDEVEARLKVKDNWLDHYIMTRKKKARSLANLICESRLRNPDKFPPTSEGDMDTSQHAAQLADARRGKRKLDEGRSLLSQQLASGPAGDPVVVEQVVDDVPHGVSLGPGDFVNQHHMLDEVDDELFSQAAAKAEAEYYQKKATNVLDWGEMDDELDSQVADAMEAAYAAQKTVPVINPSPCREDASSSDEDLLSGYVSPS